LQRAGGRPMGRGKPSCAREASPRPHPRARGERLGRHGAEGGAGRGWPEVALALVYAEEDACGALSSEDEGEDGSEVEEGSEEDGE